MIDFHKALIVGLTQEPDLLDSVLSSLDSEQTATILSEVFRSLPKAPMEWAAGIIAEALENPEDPINEFFEGVKVTEAITTINGWLD